MRTVPQAWHPRGVLTGLAELPPATQPALSHSRHCSQMLEREQTWGWERPMPRHLDAHIGRREAGQVGLPLHRCVCRLTRTPALQGPFFLSLPCLGTYPDTRPDPCLGTYPDTRPDPGVQWVGEVFDSC